MECNTALSTIAKNKNFRLAKWKCLYQQIKSRQFRTKRIWNENVFREKELICDQGRNWGAERRRGGGVSSEWQKFRPSSRNHAWRQIAVRTIPYPTLCNSTIDLLCHFQNSTFSALHFPSCQDNDWILAIFASFNILVLNFSSKITSTTQRSKITKYNQIQKRI